jgi:hypothetical protein
VGLQVSWLKLDDAMGEHRKSRRAIRNAGVGAFGIHALALLHCSRYLTDGFVDQEFLDETFDVAKTKPRERKLIVEALENAGLWHRADDGWVIHDYLDHNPSKAEVEAKRAEERAKKSAAGKKGAKARWAKEANGTDMAACHESANGTESHAGPNAPMAPSRPVPSHTHKD